MPAACPIRAEAKARGATRYFTGRPCIRGHVAERMVSTNSCVACKNEHVKRYYTEDPERFRRYSQTSRARAKANGVVWHVDKEAARESAKRWRVKNRDKANATALRWRKKHPERYAAAQKRWFAANAARVRKHALSRYAIRRRAMWVPDEHRPAVKHLYEMARDLRLHVDHIVPLKHEQVCGLHTLWNLRLLGPELNLAKHNRFEVR